MAEKGDRACLDVLAFLHGALLLEQQCGEPVSHQELRTSSSPGVFQGLAPDGDC